MLNAKHKQRKRKKRQKSGRQATKTMIPKPSTYTTSKRKWSVKKINIANKAGGCTKTADCHLEVTTVESNSLLSE